MTRFSAHDPVPVEYNWPAAERKTVFRLLAAAASDRRHAVEAEQPYRSAYIGRAKQTLGFARGINAALNGRAT